MQSEDVANTYMQVLNQVLMRMYIDMCSYVLICVNNQTHIKMWQRHAKHTMPLKIGQPTVTYWVRLPNDQTQLAYYTCGMKCIVVSIYSFLVIMNFTTYIPQLLVWATQNLRLPLYIYIYDTHSNQLLNSPFLALVCISPARKRRKCEST